MRAADRIRILQSHVTPGIPQVDSESTAGQAKKTYTLTDNSSGKGIELVVEHDSVPATKLPFKIYDPSYRNTAAAKSTICFVDGDNGRLLYRGYPIEQLAEHSTYLEVSFLLINGELPTKAQLASWNRNIMQHNFLHENLKSLMSTFRFDAHPMGQVISTISALSTFYPEANPSLQGTSIFNEAKIRNKQIFRILGKLPTIAASAYRHRIGRGYNDPRTDLSYVDNFLYMMDRLNENDYRPHPVLVRALDVIFILHAEHELNCSTAAFRHISSAQGDPYNAVAGAGAALYGPLHGGANEAVLRMLEEIGSRDNVKQFLEDVKAKKKLLMGFGHRIYKNYDPRAKIVRKVAYEVFDVVGKEPLIEVATYLEECALADSYFVERKLYPNVDFYSGLIFRAMGFPTDMFPVLFMIPRAAGWLAHWLEGMDDKEQAIWRPRQVYTGPSERPYVSMDKRVTTEKMRQVDTYSSPFNKRRNASKL